jgi:hypothetical protein
VRRCLFTLAFLCVSACGGDSSTEATNFRFPAVAGLYQLQGVLNSPPGSGQFSGTLTIRQPSRDASSLYGSADVTVTVAGRRETFTTITFAELADGGFVQFYLASPTSTNTFHFMGQFGGRNMSGRTDITLTNSSVYFGTFTATR